MQPPETGDTWLSLGDDVLPVAATYEWCVQPTCGAVVLFSGTVRDHAVDELGAERHNIGHLTYEAYEAQVVPKFVEIVDELRRRWPSTGRVAVLHRTGVVQLGESSVVVAVSSPHRPEAFEAGRFAIDALKSSAPIWKHEQWDGGEGWGAGAIAPVSASAVPTVGPREQAS